MGQVLISAGIKGISPLPMDWHLILRHFYSDGVISEILQRDLPV